MEKWLIFFCSVLLLGMLAQWLAWRFRFPSIVALLIFGFIAGQFFDQSTIVNDNVLFALVSLSVSMIMLEGGLTLRFRELKESGKSLTRLISVGAAITWILSASALHWLAGFSWPVALLIGSILVVTGPTVIGPLLRNVRPKQRLDWILKWEGIVIDPIGAILAVLVFGALFGHDGHTSSWYLTLANLCLTVLVGIGFGFGAAKGIVFVLRRHWVPDFLQSVMILSVAMALFTLSNFIQHESGLLTVTVLGIKLANQNVAKIRHIIEFKENLRIILISCLFIILGGRVGWQDMLAVWKETVLMLVALIAFIRPAAVFASTYGTVLSRKEKIFLSLMAPRGIVAAAISAIFALELSHLGGSIAEEASRIVPIVFGIIFGTVTFYGLAAAPIARKLGLASPNPQGVMFAGANPWSIKAAVVLQNAGFRVLMVDSNYQATQRARMEGVTAFNANVLSSYSTEEIDLHGIGRMLAVTPNDEINSLACLGFGHTLGRSNVYQLLPNSANETERKTSSYHELSGRILFNGSMTSTKLRELDATGAVVKSTPITETFTYEDYRHRYGPNAVSLFIIRKSGTLAVVTEEVKPPSDGDTLISLIPNGESISTTQSA